MKKIFLLISSLIVIGANAQFLSLKDLIKLQSKNLTEAQEYLAKNDWKFNNAKESKSQKMSIVSFAYGRNKLELKKARGWLKYIYNEEKGLVRINYEMYKSDEFNDLLKDAKRKEFSLVKTEIKTGRLITIYSNKEYYLILNEIKIENPTSVSVRYVIMLKTAADYLIQIKTQI